MIKWQKIRFDLRELVVSSGARSHLGKSKKKNKKTKQKKTQTIKILKEETQAYMVQKNTICNFWLRPHIVAILSSFRFFFDITASIFCSYSIMFHSKQHFASKVSVHKQILFVSSPTLPNIPKAIGSNRSYSNLQIKKYIKKSLQIYLSAVLKNTKRITALNTNR